MPPVHSSKNKSSLAMQPPAKKFFDLANIGLVLIFWDIFLGIPVSYLLTTTNKRVIQYLGYEKIMRCPSGIFFSRLLFVAINMVIVMAWAIQLAQEERYRIEVLRDIGFWDEEIVRLQILLDLEREKRDQEKIENQLENERRDTEEGSVTSSDERIRERSFTDFSVEGFPYTGEA